MTRDHIPTKEEADRVYEQHVKPLEKHHKGAFVVVTAEPSIIIVPTLMDAMREASEISTKPSFVFKVGDKVVGRV